MSNPVTRMSESNPLDDGKDLRSLALTPTWSVATVLTIFVAVSLLVERSIHRLGNVSVFFMFMLRLLPVSCPHQLYLDFRRGYCLDKAEYKHIPV